MAMMISVRGVRQLDSSIWKVQLSPQEVRFLSAKPFSYGEFSILLLSEPPHFDKEKDILQFAPSNVNVLNIGASADTIIIADKAMALAQPVAQQVPDRTDLLKKGDSEFLKDLPTSITKLGAAIIHAVRAEFSGDLKLYPKSGKYVETPDNFWTIRPQGRDQSFRITVRGLPESFSGLKYLALMSDMTGYSAFKVSNISHIEEFISILHQVKKK